MQQRFSKNDLVRYVYGELPPQQCEALESLIYSDPELEKEYYNLKNLKLSIDELEMEPDKGVMERISSLLQRINFYHKTLGVN